MTTPSRTFTPIERAAINAAIEVELAAAKKTLVSTNSKPQHIKDLRKTWRKSTEHKVAQIKRFVSAMAAVLVANITGDVVAHKDPLAHFTDLRTAWYYLIPFAYVAWRQVHPAMTASQADSAPGVTIVPEQVGVPTPEPAPTVDSFPPADPTPAPPGGTAP